MRRRHLLLATTVALFPTFAYAQAVITGAVKDASGGVLPGVTVEASSAALIEKSRAAVTDGSGQYRIVDLRPGTYTVTFALSGFRTVRREGIELTGSFTAVVNADLSLGAVEETITVVGETPIVDVQGVTRQRVMNQEIIEAIPTGRNQYNLGVLIPGVTTNSLAQHDVGGAAGLDAANSIVVHGSEPNSQRITQNGITLGTILAGGYGGGAVPNASAVQEWTFDYSGVSAELPTGGVRINFIPKEGANTFKGVVFASFTDSSLQGGNFSQDLRNRGLLYPNLMKRVWDVNPGFGGPIVRDRVWFYTSVRSNGAWNFVPGMLFNRNANNPGAWTFDGDPEAPASNEHTWKDVHVRLTSQLTRRHKVAISFDAQSVCKCPNSISATTAPEATIERRFPRQPSVQGDWTFPATSRLLLDGAVMYRIEGWAHNPSFVTRPAARLEGLNPAMISVRELAGTIPGLLYRAAPTYAVGHNWALYYRVAASYITGAHAFKVGFNNGSGSTKSTTYNFQPVSYTFRDGVPQSLTQYATPYSTTTELDNDLGVYVQDRWTRDRLTLTLGLRYDFTSTGNPDQSLGPGALVPNRLMRFPSVDGLRWHDITPKTGASYDLFGNGTTAVKFLLSKYLAGQLVPLAGQLNPVSTLVTSTTRTWRDANRDFVPDCDLTVMSANGECLAVSNPNFGTVVRGSTFDPDLTSGWGKRSYNWEFAASVEQKLSERMSVDVGYFRRWYGNFVVTDDLALASSDFDTFSVPAPADTRLPNGGGYEIEGFYNVVPARFGVPADNFVTLSDDYGRQIKHWNGVDVNVTLRSRAGMFLQGGTSTGRTSTDNCQVIAKVPEANPLGAPYCHQDTRWLTQVKFLGAYSISKIGVQVSGTFQSLPGPEILGTYNAPFAAYGPSLGRIVSGGNLNSTVAVGLVAPGTRYGDRLNQLDLRVGKIITAGRTRATFNVDLYNALNANPVMAVNTTFNAGPVATASAAWLAPRSILTARFVKFSAQIDF